VSDKSLTARDGIELEAEWSVPDTVRATVVLCHPHPQYGGTMRSIVISALFEHLPALGYACLRFNFRGVENSGGAWDDGRSELLDVAAAVEAAADAHPGPLILAGWSFGGDMALATRADAIRAWIGIAPPLRFRSATDYVETGADARPKLLILGANDEFRSPEQVEADVRDWSNTRVEVIAGASHFFVGRTDRVVALAAEFVEGLALP
jgi:alpha/beta superfamily hydrolase